MRRRPGMYVGGTDSRALHHLLAEALDNAVDEALGGFARRIDVSLLADGSVSVVDDGRGIPVEPHPRFPSRSALEIVMTTLHAGGKFGSGAYRASGGLHGVGISAANALSERFSAENRPRRRRLATDLSSRHSGFASRSRRRRGSASRHAD